VTVVTAMPNYPTGVVHPAYKGRFVLVDEIEGIPVIRTWIFASTGRNVFLRLASYLSFCCTCVAGCLRGPRPDYILVESPPLFLCGSALIVGLLRRAPFVMIVSDLWPASARDLGFISNRVLLWLAERFEALMYHTAFRIAAVTEGIRDTVAGSVGRAKVTFLPNGVDTDLFRPGGNNSAGILRPGEVGFLYAGTHSYYQGLDLILDAAERVRDLPEVVFSFVGDGPEKVRLRREADRRGLTNVRFHDPRAVSEMPPLFAESRASIALFRNVPLFRGGRPAKIFPSLACGTPVIFSGAGETAVLIESSGCGLVTPPGSPSELADAVRRLAKDPALAHELGDAGRRLVEREYTWSGIVERWLAQLPERDQDRERVGA
jgi:colanic acid biosynthesis glycosyl transferase WcaI